MNSLIRTENLFHRSEIGKNVKNFIIHVDNDKENLKMLVLMLFKLTKVDIAKPNRIKEFYNNLS